MMPSENRIAELEERTRAMTEEEMLVVLECIPPELCLEYIRNKLARYAYFVDSIESTFGNFKNMF
jgi:hypothetical protein